MKYSKVLAALAFSAIISAESVALEPVRHTVFSTDMVTGMYNLDNTIPVNVKVVILDLDEEVAANQVKYVEQHTVIVNKFGFLQFEIGDINATVISGVFNTINLKPSLVVKTYVVDGINSRIIDSKRMSEIIYNANVSRYSHTVNVSPAERLTGANVIDQIEVNEHGVLTTTTRALTPADIGAASTGQLADGLALKVDKETGKSLMTDAERTKLAGIEENANKYIHPVNHPASIITQDANNRFVTDAEKTTWNNKVDKEAGKSLMTDAERTKLAGIEENANKYIHPVNHPASIITQDANNRFVSDADTAKWNAGTSLTRGHIFIGDVQNKPVATLGGPGEVLMVNGVDGVYNGFAKIKDANIANDAAISGTKITPDFGSASVINGGSLSISEINVLTANPYQGTIYAQGTISSDGGFEGELTTTGNVVAGDINVVEVSGTSNGSIIAEGTITGAELISDGAITATGDITGANITTAGEVTAESATFNGTILATDIQVDAGNGNAGDIYAAGTITAGTGFSGPLSGNATTATNLEDASADNTVYLGNTTGNAWGKITNDHIGAAAEIADTKLATIATAGKVANTATTATNAKTANAIVARDAQGGFVAGNVTVDQLSTANGSTAGMIVGETAGTAWANVNKGGKAVLEMGLGTDGANPAGYGIKINDDNGVTKAGIGRSALGWSAGVQGTGTAAGAMTTGAADAKLAVMNGVNEVFSADQTGKIAAAELALTAKATSAATVAGDAATTLTTKGYVDGLALTAGNGISIAAQVISAKIDGPTLSNGADGLKLNINNPNTWTAAQVLPTTEAQGNALVASVNAGTTKINGTNVAPNFGTQNVVTTGTVTAPTFIGDLNGAAATLAATEAAGNSAVAAANLSTGTKIAGAKVNPDFGAQNVVTTGTVTASTFNGDLNGNALTASTASALANTVVAGNSAVAAINKSTVTRIAGDKVNPDFTGQNILGDALVISVDGEIIIGSNLDAFVVDGATGDVTAKGTVTAPTFDGDLTGNATTATNLTAGGANNVYLGGAVANSWSKITNNYVDDNADIAATKLATGDVDNTEFNVLNGITSTTAELNILDGVTATAAEINILDGVTANFSEINVLDGITSTTAELNILDGVTADFSEINVLDGILASTAELNILDGVTATAAEINILDGVTADFNEINVLDGATAGTVVASKAVVVNGTKDVTGFNSVTATTFTGALVGNATTATNLTVGGANNVYLGGAVANSWSKITNNYVDDNAAIAATKLGTGLVDNTEFNVLNGITSTTAELNILDGVTADFSEINALDGILASTAELNILDGVTATAAEINILDGVTANFTEINVLDGITSTTAELNILDGVTADFSEINVLDGITSTTAELNILDGVTATATEINALDGVSTAGGNIIKIGNGAANQYLKTNGDGTVAWATVVNTLQGVYDGSANTVAGKRITVGTIPVSVYTDNTNSTALEAVSDENSDKSALNVYANATDANRDNNAATTNGSAIYAQSERSNAAVKVDNTFNAPTYNEGVAGYFNVHDGGRDHSGDVGGNTYSKAAAVVALNQEMGMGIIAVANNPLETTASTASAVYAEAKGPAPAIYVENTYTGGVESASAAVALKITAGKTVLAYGNIDDQATFNPAGTADLTNWGNYTVINLHEDLTDDGGGALSVPVTAITMPGDAEDGQILYIANNTGLAINDGVYGLIGNGSIVAFVYAGGGWRKI